VRFSKAWVLASTFLGLLLLAGCSRPKPPTITPEKAEVTAIGPGGVELLVKLGIDNPNRVALSARSVTGRVVLDGKHDLGTVTVPHAFQLPSGQRSHLTVPLALAWKDLPALLALAATNRNIPYDVHGSVSLGGDVLNADIPFRLTGALTHDELVRATVNSLPRLPFP
jgi:LEA14-like dessication related protein